MTGNSTYSAVQQRQIVLFVLYKHPFFGGLETALLCHARGALYTPLLIMSWKAQTLHQCQLHRDCERLSQNEKLPCRVSSWSSMSGSPRKTKAGKALTIQANTDGPLQTNSTSVLDTDRDMAPPRRLGSVRFAQHLSPDAPSTPSVTGTKPHPASTSSHSCVGLPAESLHDA